ncbi:hypothetical protein D4R75_11540 [bacterium]|nr:MAG: hypothetical protein D4R75_11540 [bacterium]
MKNILVFLVLGASLSLPAFAQVQLSGEASAYSLKSSRSQNPRVVNKGNATFGWRFDLFVDGKVTDNVYVLVNTRSFEDDPINFDYAAIRITDFAGLGFNVQMGKFDMPFGNLAERRFPTKNFLYGLPLIYEYRTSLPAQVAGRVEVLNNRTKGVGMRLLDFGIYDIGAMLYGDIGRLHYAIAGSNGTISSTSSRQLNQNQDFNKIVRLAYTPMMGLTVGASAAMGAYLADGGKPLPRDEGSNHYQQLIGEADFEFSRDRFLLNGEAVYSQWTVPFENEDTKLSVLGYYAEAKYTWFPRFSTAARVSGLIFSKLNIGDASVRWDNNVLEVEAGIGYHIDRNTIIKIIRRETRTPEVTGMRDNLTVLQLAVSF